MIISFCHNVRVWQTDKQTGQNSYSKTVRCITCSRTVKTCYRYQFRVSVGVRYRSVKRLSRCRTSYSRRIISCTVATDKFSPPKMATSSGLFLATIYNQSQLGERYWSIDTAATAVPLSAHPSPLVITTKLAAAILGGRLFGGGVLPSQYCPCGVLLLLLPIGCQLGDRVISHRIISTLVSFSGAICKHS